MKKIEDILHGIANEYSAGACYEGCKPLTVDRALTKIEQHVQEAYKKGYIDGGAEQLNEGSSDE